MLKRTHALDLCRAGDAGDRDLPLGSKRDERATVAARHRVASLYAALQLPALLVGEARPMRTSRREIGHGTLALRALGACGPVAEDFPYTARSRDHRVERLKLDGERLRWLDGDDGGRRAAAQAGRWDRHGDDQRGRRRGDPLDILGDEITSVTWTSRSPNHYTTAIQMDIIDYYTRPRPP